METSPQARLAQIHKKLQEVGDRLSAIDFGAGNPLDHWKAIGEISTVVREAALGLPPELLAQCHRLTDFAQSNRGLEGYWSSCMDEVKALLK